MFRDRVVSMEQTLEGGEKNLEFLKGLCREAFPDFSYREHSLDHERDLFVITLEAADGRRKVVGWTRMVLFDAERLPSLVENPVSPLRSRVLAYLQARAARTEIVVTFRHLEDGWVDTPEPRKEKRRGRRGGREGRGGGRSRPDQAAKPPRPPEPAGRGARPPGRPERGSPAPSSPREARPPAGVSAAGPPAPAAAVSGSPEAARGEGGAPPVGRRRRFRRRRRGRGGPGASAPGAGAPPSGGKP
jgi:hypothetical protein